MKTERKQIKWFLKCIFFLSFQCFFFQYSLAQNALLYGKIIDEDENVLPSANIFIKQTNLGTSTDTEGNFSLKVKANEGFTLVVSYLGFQNQEIGLRLVQNEERFIKVVLKKDTAVLQTIEIKANKLLLNNEISLQTLDPQSSIYMPSATGDFNKILATLAGVVSNNELSSTYSVRGGNFDENLVYVNDIEIYRPFLVKAGQQEGLSFINPDMVKTVAFSAGSWQPKYGDKLSSLLNVTYKEPTKWNASVNLGFMGGSAAIEGATLEKKLSFVIGARYRDARYLLNTLPTKGEYLPRFADIQSFISYKISLNTKLDLLVAYAQNRYFIQPTTRQTDFGTAAQTLRLTVAFDGSETLQYDIWQNALRLTQKLGEKFETAFIFSTIYTREREYQELEGGYRLAEVQSDPNNPNGNLTSNQRELGTIYQHGRNQLQATIIQADIRNRWKITENHEISFGAKFSSEQINDRLSEYSFIDSADYVTPDRAIQSKLGLSSERWAMYLQHDFQIKERHFFSYGLRTAYWNINREWLFSPRFQYAFQPNWVKEWVFKVSVGVYQQPPFYRELRDRQGSLNLDLKAQKSLNFVLGAESIFKIANRNFRWTGELYYRNLWDVIPYDVDNVRIRYFAQNNAKAFAYGADFRISGEFVRNAVSWFSLSYLNTQEDIEGDGLGYIRRPTDQRITFAAYFEDYIPQSPTWRINLQLIIGSGLPFSPPDSPIYRASLKGPFYRRIDLGFSKMIVGKKTFQSLWIGLDILNILGIENTISYNWIKDVNQQQFAVPNTLSTRFINLRAIAKF